MPIQFDANKIDWESALARPQYGQGLKYVGFIDHRGYNQGAGLGNVFGRFLKFLLPLAKTAGKHVGREVLQTGSQILSDLAQDSSNVTATVKKRGTEGMKNVTKRAVMSLGGRRKVKKKTTKGGGLGTINGRKFLKRQPERYHIPVF